MAVRVEPTSNVQVMNNLFLGTDYSGRGILRAGAFTSYSTFDYNGWRYNDDTENQFQWKAPPEGTLQDYSGNFISEAPWQSFSTLEDFSRATGRERHGVVVDYDIFENVAIPDPAEPWTVYRTENLDFRLKEGSKAVDKGCLIPNVNDDYTGAAPDLGAYERGTPPPLYGPRTK